MSVVVTDVEKRVFRDGFMRLRMCNEHGYVQKILFIDDDEATVGMDETQMEKLWLRHQALMLERTRIVTDKAAFAEWEDTLSRAEQDTVMFYMSYDRTCRKCGGDGRVTQFDETEQCGYCDGYGADPDQKKYVADYERIYDTVMRKRDQNYNDYRFENVT